MKFYQWVAVGTNKCFGSGFKRHSKRIFSSPEHAEEYKQEFIDSVLRESRDKSDGGDGGLFGIDQIEKLKLVELIFEE